MKDQIKILAQGKGWIGVEKPAGISVHNEPGRDLVSILEKRLGKKVHPVHRLDRATSGVLLLAHDSTTLARLAAAFAANQVEKQYIALVHGNFTQNSGTWDQALSPGAAGRTLPAGRGKKQRALTHYRVQEQSPHYALLEIRLETGRTHQIRRHAKLAGHPLTGDSRYGSKRAVTFLIKQRDFRRMGLHAAQLHLKSQEDEIHLISPSIPEEILTLIREDKS